MNNQLTNNQTKKDFDLEERTAKLAENIIEIIKKNQNYSFKQKNNRTAYRICGLNWGKLLRS